MEEVTVFDWLQNFNDYQLNDISLFTIAIDRGIEDPKTALYAQLSTKERELMLADMLRRAILFGPSNTASISESHSGYQKTIGSRSDAWRNDKINWANSIYKKYDDPNIINNAAILRVMNPFR